MRTGKELMMASKNFAAEDLLRSWLEIVLTIALAATTFVFLLLQGIPLALKILATITCGLLYVRLFVIYHE